MIKSYIFLFISILLEILATNFLKLSHGFSVWSYSILALIFYSICFYFFSLSLKILPLGIAYAIWSGIGILILTLIGIFIYKDKIDFVSFLGIFLIILGVLTLTLFSKINQ